MTQRTAASCIRSTTSTCAAAAAVRHLVPDRRLSGRQRLLRRKRVAAVERVEQAAYGTAFCLAQRRAAGGAKVIGLTSPGKLAFTESLDCHDSVLTYDAVAALPADVPTVYVDFGGSAGVRAGIHSYFGARLTYSCSVGGTHGQDLGSGKGLPGLRPTLFSAPAQMKKRNADWGPDGLQQRLANAWTAFMQPVTDAQRPWLRVVRGRGQAAVESTCAALLAGRVKPVGGHVLAIGATI